jgi:hypothetical protein
MKGKAIAMLAGRLTQTPILWGRGFAEGPGES